MGISAGLGSSALLPAGLGFRNILINGNMVVNQRNAAVTSTGYVVDRWSIESGGGSASKSVAQSTDAPAGYTNSLKATCTTGASGNTLFFSQKVEGYNSAFLGWGASGAKQVTISFWVKSSLTGTYSVALHNPTRARVYVATYSISSANTWEYKTIMVQGDSSGTWETTTSTGIQVMFCFGTSSGGYQTSTLNQWFAGDGMSIPIGPSTVPDVMTTTNNVFAITGVQLEQNYQATPFEQRPYGVELALCQRYYEKSYAQSTAPGTATDTGFIMAMTGGAQAGSSGIHDAYFYFKVEKRASATMVIYDNAGNANKCRRTAVGVANYDNQSVQDVTGYHNGCYFRSGSGSGTTNTVSCHYTASAELL